MNKILPITLVIFVVSTLENVHAACKRSITTASGTAAPKSICSGDLIFEDNFDTFDLKKWDHEQTLGGGGNLEFQWYTNNRSNSYTQNGVLHIKPTFVADEYGENFLHAGTIDLGNDCTNPDNDGCRRTGIPNRIVNPVKSARIRTLNSFSFKYGKIEFRAKVPAGDWLWPAIWMLPTKWIYGGWPTSGEIDIVESRGNRQHLINGNDIGLTLSASTLHWGPNPNNNRYPLTQFEKHLAAGYDRAFHKYQAEWTPDYIAFFIDNKQIGRVTPPAGGFWELGNLGPTGLPNSWQNGGKMAPFDAEFHLIINLAIGGNFFPDNVGDKPWTNYAPSSMTDFWKANKKWKPTWNLNTDDAQLKVDYVKVWAL